MEVYIVLTEPKLDSIKTEDKQKIIINSSKAFTECFDVSDEIIIKLCEGNVNDSVTTAVAIIKASSLGRNAGDKVRAYKEKLAEIFTLVGINNAVISVKVDPNYELPQIKSDEPTSTKDEEEFDYEKRADLYKPVDPAYSFNRVIMPKEVLEKIEESLNVLQYEDKVFNEWGLSVIQPHPSSALSFYGPSGTGKTMAAEAIADKLGKKILKVSYADIESKFHGEGPKMVKAIFLAAQKEDAVLFIDEADSLLSKRLTNVTQGSEQAINSMRSQLLICLEEFRGIVIFATNLVINYDQAFLTRLISVKFIMPDQECREKIWDVHIKPVEGINGKRLNIPLDETVDTKKLAEQFEFCGREIRSAVISACVRAAMAKKDCVSQEDFIAACEKIITEKEDLANAKDHTESNSGGFKIERISVEDKAKKAIAEALTEKMKEQTNNTELVSTAEK